MLRDIFKPEILNDLNDRDLNDRNSRLTDNDRSPHIEVSGRLVFIPCSSLLRA